MNPVTRTENDTLVEVALNSAEPSELVPGKVYGWATSTGVHKVDLTGDAYRDTPRRKTGTTTVNDLESFGLYWDKHADTDVAETYADIDTGRLTAVLDAHGSTIPGWRDHRLIYPLRRTAGWNAWAHYDNKLVGQVEFAELLEARLPDIAEPDGADLLELAQTFQATTSVAFKSGNLLANGQRELLYSEQIEASGGRGGKKLLIPKGITLHIAPYDGADPAVVTARFRYRINDGNLRLGFVLDRPAEILADAFNEVIEQAETLIGRQIMRGTPA